MYEFALGFMVCAWFATLTGVGYALYRYVYLPWKVMRKDLKDLTVAVENGFTAVKTEMGLRKALLPSDEESARAEQAARLSRYLR